MTRGDLIIGALIGLAILAAGVAMGWCAALDSDRPQQGERP